ncbi:MAG: ribosome-binding factor A [Mycoplasmataceae bacterium]|nr:ribosome-binding factor A [Mycoplasmataceae bacterium]
MQNNNNRGIEKKLFSFFTETITYKVTNSNIKKFDITKVELSNDKDICRIYLNKLSTSNKTFNSLNNIKPFLRGELSKIWDHRRLPKIEFVWDEKNNNVENVIDILDKLKNERENK